MATQVIKDRYDPNKAKKYPQGYFKPKKCRYCNITFTPVAPSNHYCCEECAVKAYEDGYYMRNYGLVKEQFEVMKEAQNFKCAICGGEGFIMNSKKTHREKLVIDHDHKTGVVRGLLCHNCNRALGLFQDDVEIMQKAIQYLNKSREGATTIREE